MRKYFLSLIYVGLFSSLFSACSQHGCYQDECMKTQEVHVGEKHGCHQDECIKIQEVHVGEKIVIQDEPKKEVEVEKPNCDTLRSSGIYGEVLCRDKPITISVVGQGVAPMNTTSPAQAYALAKRAAVADSYRLIAEKVKGVYVEGDDLVSNMMVKRSNIRTSVAAMVRNANIVETSFKEGLCEVEMEIVLAYSQFAQ